MTRETLNELRRIEAVGSGCSCAGSLVTKTIVSLSPKRLWQSSSTIRRWLCRPPADQSTVTTAGCGPDLPAMSLILAYRLALLVLRHCAGVPVDRVESRP